MAYITPHTWTNEQATVALMNEISNNIKALFPVGTYTYLLRSATTSETYLDACWLECNGVSVLRATYPALNTLLSGLGYPFGTVDGTHFTLPDAQGRAPVSMSSGGHADVNALGDSDGLAKASRSPQHNTTITGAPSNGSLAVSPNPHSHQFLQTDNAGAIAASGAAITGFTQSTPQTSTTSLSITGAPGIGSLAGGVGGSRPSDTIPFLVAGVLFVKAVT